MNQFDCYYDANGDVHVSGGWVIAPRAGVMIEVAGRSIDDARLAWDSSLSGFGFLPAKSQIYAGGSGHNLFVDTVPNDSIPNGHFRATVDQVWQGVWSTSAAWAVDPDTGELQLSDGSDVVATAPLGSMPIRGRLPCATAAVAGGDGGGEYLVDLGTDTGTVELSFDAYSVPDRFIVEWDGSEVINSGLRGDDGTYDGNVVMVDGPGSDTLSFNKTTATPTTAVVRVVSPYTGTSWQWTLGCPGGGSPPYTAVTGRCTFTASSTAYGETLNSSTPFTLDVLYEGGGAIAGARVVGPPGTLPVDTFSAVSTASYLGNVLGWSLVIATDGSATISDATDVVATRAAGGSLYDPAGAYEATLYGQATFNGSEAFTVQIERATAQPKEGYFYLLVTEASGGVPSAVAGPYFAPTLPEPADPVFAVPLSKMTGTGKLVPMHTGPILWGIPAVVESVGLVWVTISSADYLLLDPPDPDVIYDIDDVIP